MMSVLLKLLGVIAAAIGWFHDSAQRDIGKKEQEAQDEKDTIEKLHAVADAASQRDDAADILRKHEF